MKRSIGHDGERKVRRTSAHPSQTRLAGNNVLDHHEDISAENSKDGANRTLEASANDGLDDDVIILGEIEGKPKKMKIACRSIRIGSFECYPAMGEENITVILKNGSCFFRTFVSAASDFVYLILNNSEILNISYCFIHRQLQFMFIYISSTLFENIRSTFIRHKLDPPYFDPEGEKVITFLLNNLTPTELKDMPQYLKNIFPRPGAIREIKSWEETTDILIASIPCSRGLQCSHDPPQVALPIADAGDEFLLTELNCEKIKIGNFNISPSGRSQHLIFRITSKRFSFTISGKKNMSIILRYSDFTQLIFHFGEQSPAIFLHTTIQCAKRTLFQLSAINEKLMQPATETELEMQRRIAFFVTSLDEGQMSSLRKFFHNCCVPSREIDCTEVRHILNSFSDEKSEKAPQSKQTSPLLRYKPFSSVAEESIIVIDSDEENVTNISESNIEENFPNEEMKSSCLNENISSANVAIAKSLSEIECDDDITVGTRSPKDNLMCNISISKINIGRNRKAKRVALGNNLTKNGENRSNASRIRVKNKVSPLEPPAKDVCCNIAEIVKTRRRGCRNEHKEIENSDVQIQNSPSKESSLNRKSPAEVPVLCPKNNPLISNITDHIVHSDTNNSDKKKPRTASLRKPHTTFKSQKQKSKSTSPPPDAMKKGKNFNKSFDINDDINSQSTSNSCAKKKDNTDSRKGITSTEIGPIAQFSKCKNMTTKNSEMQKAAKNKKISGKIYITNSARSPKTPAKELQLKKLDVSKSFDISNQKKCVVKNKVDNGNAYKKASIAMKQAVVIMKRCDIGNHPQLKVSAQQSAVCQPLSVAKKKKS